MAEIKRRITDACAVGECERDLQFVTVLKTLVRDGGTLENGRMKGDEFRISAENLRTSSNVQFRIEKKIRQISAAGNGILVCPDRNAIRRDNFRNLIPEAIVRVFRSYQRSDFENPEPVIDVRKINRRDHTFRRARSPARLRQAADRQIHRIFCATLRVQRPNAV